MARCPGRPLYRGETVSHAVQRRQPSLTCARCGVVTLAWPANLEAIERTVAPRTAEARNWVLGESVEQLQAENVAHGLGA